MTTGSEQFTYFNAYLAENRQYTGYDDSLRLGPYNFGFPSMPNKVEHFPYQDGVLIWYWDSSYDDNNVGDHPGAGLILPIDSHPQILHWSDSGAVMRPRLQAYRRNVHVAADGRDHGAQPCGRSSDQRAVPARRLGVRRPAELVGLG